MKKLFVGSLAWATNDDTLRDHFAACGTVASAKVITDRDSGRSKGFGFVEFETSEESAAAMEELNGREVDGRTIRVTEARPNDNAGRGGGGGGGGRGGDRGGRGGGDRGGYGGGGGGGGGGYGGRR